MKVIGRLKALVKSLKQEVKVIYIALKYKKLPLAAKASAGLTIAYALSPIDLIPDFIPVLGYLDDLIILPLLIALTIKLIPKAIMIDCRREAESIWRDGWPKKWRYSILVLGLWFIIFLVILVKVVN